MKTTLAIARQVRAAEAQAELVAENNRLLRLICDKLGISIEPGEPTLQDKVKDERKKLPR